MPIVNQATSILGADIYQATTEQKHRLGTRCQVVYGPNSDKSGEAVYVRAAAALTVGLLYELPLIAGTDAFLIDTAITTTNAGTLTGATVGNAIAACVPAATLAVGEYGWAFVQGHIPVFTGTLAVAQARLFTTATGGLIDDATTTHELIGLWVLATVGGANVVVDCYCINDLTVRRIS